MLTELRISNFALIDHLSLGFSHGFHVLTGETGAGKSILVDAVALLVGGRASVEQIRAEAEEAELEAAFLLQPDSGVLERLREFGDLELSGGELVIRRVLSRSGRNRTYVNGRLTPLHLVQKLAGTLVDIHGQHEQQSLLSEDVQRDALDSLGNLRALRDEYRGRYEEWRTQQRLLEESRREAEEGRQQEEFLRFQLDEIEGAALQSGEEENLAAERARLVHAHRLEELGLGAYDALYGNDGSILNGLGAIGDRLGELGSIDPATTEWGGLCSTAAIQLKELAHQLRDYLRQLESSPDRLSLVEERLDRIQRLKRKYGGNVDALRSQAQELAARLERVASSHSRVGALDEQVEQGHAAVQALAARLSEARARVARDLEARVLKELSALRMENTRFQVDLRKTSGPDGLTATGRDRVDYLLSANKGEPLLPLAKVASGGEMSRIMLALKSVLATSDGVPVLIFDEVDAGIGGAAAEVMGRRLKTLGTFHQVFCITHLPQIASQADSHFVVEKRAHRSRTVTQVKRLDQEGRREEIARMLGGVKITRAVRETAAEMIGDRERGR